LTYIVTRVEDWIDGINQPAWQRLPKQVIGPSSEPYVLQASYVFSVNGKKQAESEADSEADPGDSRLTVNAAQRPLDRLKEVHFL
jgi:hypothetical protein